MTETVSSMSKMIVPRPGYAIAAPLIRSTRDESETDGGLILVKDKGRDTLGLASVVSDKITEDGSLTGQIVVFDLLKVGRLTIAGKEFVVLREEGIWATVEDAKEEDASREV